MIQKSSGSFQRSCHIFDLPCKMKNGISTIPNVRRFGSVGPSSPLNRAYCARFGVSLISYLPPNLPRGIFSRQIGWQFSSGKSVPETCAMRTVRFGEEFIVDRTAKSFSEFTGETLSPLSRAYCARLGMTGN